MESHKIRTPLGDISAPQLEKKDLALAPAAPPLLCPPAPAQPSLCPPPADVSDISSQLSSFLLQEDGEPLTLTGLSEEVFEQADEEARGNSSQFPKWEGMRQVPRVSFS